MAGMKGKVAAPFPWKPGLWTRCRRFLLSDAFRTGTHLFFCSMISLPYFICRLSFLEAPLAGEIVTLTCSTMLQVFSSQWVSLGPASFPL